MKFIFEMLTGEAGRLSSKRGVMVWLLLLFTFVLLYNLVTGKALSPTYSDQLFQLLCLALMTVFGEKWIAAYFALKGKKQDDPKPAEPPK